MKSDERFRNICNFRDLGGIPVAAGRTIKPGCFIRSAGLYVFNEDELKILEEEYQLKTVLDLRSGEEIAHSPDPVLPGVNYILRSGVVTEAQKEIDFSPDGMRKQGEAGKQQLSKLRSYYEEIQFGNRAFKEMFHQILYGNTPILFHCASGKDRTGIAAMLIELALGASKEDVIADYLTSNHYLKERLDIARSGVDPDKDPELYELMTMMDGVSENTIKIVFDAIERRYSSYREFIMTEYSLTEADMNYLLKTYTI